MSIYLVSPLLPSVSTPWLQLVTKPPRCLGWICGEWCKPPPNGPLMAQRGC
ncbi:MAG: hypothetical protein QG671_1506 [Actinomycetota bacterium]|nr:hypothetical protein [Actinomycetota bacterium]